MKNKRFQVKRKGVRKVSGRPKRTYRTKIQT